MRNRDVIATTTTRRTARRSLAAAIGTAAVALLAMTDAAGADERCAVSEMLTCQPSQPTTTTTAPPPTTTTTAAPAPPTSAEARARLTALVNGERTKRGLPALAARSDVDDIAMGWSDSMARAGSISHNDAYFTEDTRRRLGAGMLGENVARAGTIDQAHAALMASPHHRDNILDARFDAVGYGVVLRDGTWWVTQDFLQARRAAQHGAAPASASPVGAAPAKPTAGPQAPGAVSAAPAASAAAGARSSDATPAAAATTPAPSRLRLLPVEPNAPTVLSTTATGSHGQLRLVAVGVALVVLMSAAALGAAKRHVVQLVRPAAA